MVYVTPPSVFETDSGPFLKSRPKIPFIMLRLEGAVTDTV